MEWFDLASIAVLFDVKPNTVRVWCNKGYLPSIKKPGFFMNAEGAPRSRPQIFVSRVDLEQFMINRWSNGAKQKAAVTLSSLVEGGQLNGEIIVTISPEQPRDMNRKLAGMLSRLYVAGGGGKRLRELTANASQQQELFPDYVDHYYTTDGG